MATTTLKNLWLLVVGLMSQTGARKLTGSTSTLNIREAEETTQTAFKPVPNDMRVDSLPQSTPAKYDQSVHEDTSFTGSVDFDFIPTPSPATRTPVQLPRSGKYVRPSSVVTQVCDGPCDGGGMCKRVVGYTFCRCPYHVVPRLCLSVSACRRGDRRMCLKKRFLNKKKPNTVKPPEDNPCKSNTTCKNGSRCIPKPRNSRGYVCRCRSDYGGLNCEKVNPCESCPCLNRGYCVPNNNRRGFTCTCRHGYYGSRCAKANSCRPGHDKPFTVSRRLKRNTTSLNPCSSNPCMNKGKCRVCPTTRRKRQQKYFCVCRPGFIGRLCTERISIHWNTMRESSISTILDVCKKRKDVNSMCHAKQAMKELTTRLSRIRRRHERKIITTHSPRPLSMSRTTG